MDDEAKAPLIWRVEAQDALPGRAWSTVLQMLMVVFVVPLYVLVCFFLYVVFTGVSGVPGSSYDSMPEAAAAPVLVAFFAAPVQCVAWLILRHFEWAHRIPWWVHALFLGWIRPPFRILVPALFPPLLFLTPLLRNWVITMVFSSAFLAWRLLAVIIVELRAGTPPSELHMCEAVRTETVWLKLVVGVVAVLCVVVSVAEHYYVAHAR